MNPRTGNPLVRIGVMGVGGAGGNAVNRMIDERDRSTGAGGSSIFNDVVVLAANTDTQDLEKSKAEGKVQLGALRTSGWGAGARPEVGREAAEESRIEIANHIDGLDMLFLTAGMGGGTGTGASPVIAGVAKEAGILTVGVVTTPFCFEGRKKMKIAQEGIENLRSQVDTLVIIPNEKLVSIADGAGYLEMFRRSDDVLINAVRSLALLIANKATINVDFADVRTTMVGMGTAMIGIGSAAGENAAVNAVKEALSNPLMSDVSIKGAKRALLHLGGINMPMRELEAAGRFVSEQLHEDADFIWGISVEETADKVYALVVAEASQTARPMQSGHQVGATVAPVRATKESQVTLFEPAPAKVETAAKSVATIAAPVPAAVPAPVPAMQQAEPAPQAKGVLRDKMQKVDYNESFLFNLPDDMPADPNDPNVPAVIRQQMKQQKKPETPPQAAPEPVIAETAPTGTVEQQPAKRVDERQTTVFTVNAARKNDHTQNGNDPQ